MNFANTNRLAIMTVKINGMRAGLAVTLTIRPIDEFVKSRNWDGKVPVLRLFEIKNSAA